MCLLSNKILIAKQNCFEYLTFSLLRKTQVKLFTLGFVLFLLSKFGSIYSTIFGCDVSCLEPRKILIPWPIYHLPWFYFRKRLAVWVDIPQMTQKLDIVKTFRTYYILSESLVFPLTWINVFVCQQINIVH